MDESVFNVIHRNSCGCLLECIQARITDSHPGIAEDMTEGEILAEIVAQWIVDRVVLSDGDTITIEGQ